MTEYVYSLYLILYNTLVKISKNADIDIDKFMDAPTIYTWKLLSANGNKYTNCLDKYDKMLLKDKIFKQIYNEYVELASIDSSLYYRPIAFLEEIDNYKDEILVLTRKYKIDALLHRKFL